MSGPKVVKVVTREELLARAQDQISALECAVERYAAFGRRHDVDLSAEIGAHRNEVSQLRAFTQTASWDIIERRSKAIIQTVEHHRKELEDNLIAAASKDRMVRRRLKDAARAIQREFQALSIAVPSDLEDVIANAEKATIDQLKNMDAIVVAASRVLVGYTSSGNEIDSALAKRLAAGLNQENYTDWLAKNALGVESKKLLQLDKIIAELQLRNFVMTKSVTEAIKRIQRAGDEERDLLIDSLIIELLPLLNTQRQREEALARLDEKIGLLEREGSREAEDVIMAMRAAHSNNGDDLTRLEQRANDIVENSRAKANSVHQRLALLSGLTALGYEVREGMATALVENGRLVVKKPAEVEYGVEVVSSAVDGRLQVRMVSFQSASNPIRDRDIEVIWCGEFTQLQAKLARLGHTLGIEKALAPGVAPIKREQLPVEEDFQAGGEVKRPKGRLV